MPSLGFPQASQPPHLTCLSFCGLIQSVSTTERHTLPSFLLCRCGICTCSCMCNTCSQAHMFMCATRAHRYTCSCVQHVLTGARVHMCATRVHRCMCFCGGQKLPLGFLPFSFLFFNLLNLLICMCACICVRHSMYMQSGPQLEGVISLLPPCRPSGSQLRLSPGWAAC